MPLFPLADAYASLNTEPPKDAGPLWADPALATRRAAVAARLEALDFELPPQVAATAELTGTVSELVLNALVRDPGGLAARVLEGDAPDPLARLDLSECTHNEALVRLRRYRQTEMARIAWRDIAGWSDLEASLADLSALADGMIRLALRRAESELASSDGTAQTADGEPAPLLVLGMGKLGGRELNFSSDIDLVFVYPDDAVITGEKTIEPERYYRRVAQLLIKLLDEKTADGFVFRVDARLRPFGASGPLAVSLSAFETYLVQHGRDWERYAYVKARLITGERWEDEVFAQVLTPFVYRRYLDYGMFDALRQMKRLIAAEVARKDMQRNIKLGAGGIREVEFLTQIFQIVRGGQDPRLRSRHLLDALPAVARAGALDAEDARRLVASYRFLRIVENRLQALEDKQTHDLPQDPERRARLALALHYDSWSALAADVARHRQVVADEFGRIAWLGESADAADEPSKVLDAWEAGDISAVLAGTALDGDAELADVLARLRESGLYRRMDEPSRKRLGAVVARLVPMLESRHRPGAVFARVLPILEATCRRSAYLALLNENPTALDRLLSLAGESPMLARQMTEHPALLDELLDPRLFDSPPTREELARSLTQHVGAADDDAESRVDAIRQFQRAAVFRIAIADRLGGLPLMKVSDRLTDTAELVLQAALDLASRELEAAHGRPMHGAGRDALAASAFAVIAYGKLGGLELGYGSDLDLVFIHDSEGAIQETSGPRVIENQQFFARLVQRLIHFLTIQTTSGRLYEIDTRLRPSGASGLMVASLASFRKYQREQAWTWEHQALLRSRAVAGDQTLMDTFERERRDVLIGHVERDGLAGSIARMRARMRAELTAGKPGWFDIKQDAGGLADIEFLVDYWVLANANRHPELVTYPDNVRQLEALEAAGLVPGHDCDLLKTAYLAYRSRIHELALMEAGKLVADDEFERERAAIVALWQSVFGHVADEASAPARQDL